MTPENAHGQFEESLVDLQDAVTVVMDGIDNEAIPESAESDLADALETALKKTLLLFRALQAPLETDLIDLAKTRISDVLETF